jgi:hypothetical protein
MGGDGLDYDITDASVEPGSRIPMETGAGKGGEPGRRDGLARVGAIRPGVALCGQCARLRAGPFHGFGMTTNRDEVVFSVRKGRRNLALLGVAVPVLIGVVIAGVKHGWGDGIIAFAVGVFGVVVFTLGIKPVGHPVLRLDDAGVQVYEPGRKSPRVLPWSMISGVEHQVFSGSEPRFGGQRSSPMLVFRLMAMEWGVTLPAGAPPAEEMVAAIRARIRPEVAAKSDSMEAPAFFETIFHIRLPDAAKVVHAEWHPADKSGWWSVRIGQDEFLKLKTTAGAVSEWFPLTRDQRFDVGGRRLVGTQDIRGEYAISRQEWDATPVLVWDSDAGVLHGMLTRSVA